MAHSPADLWRRTKQKGTPDIVGQVFEDMAQMMLRNATLSDDADLEVFGPQMAMGIEVKATGGRTCRLPERQFNHYVRISDGFPFTTMMYIIFEYRNDRTVRRGIKRGTQLNRCKTSDQVKKFVVQNCVNAYALDHRIIAAVKKMYGSRKRAFPGNPEQTAIMLSRSFLRSIAQRDTRFLSGIGLSPEQWVSTHYKVELPGSYFGSLVPIEFPLFVTCEATFVSTLRRSYSPFVSPLSAPALL